jgi:hypothetical protein
LARFAVISPSAALVERFLAGFFFDDCGVSVDRDENASVNLEVFAASSAVSACGEARSGAVRKNRVKRASKKQEGSGLAEVA